MRVYFFHRHVRDTVIILEEGNLPNPQCPRCNMLVPWQTLNGRHPATAQCAKGEERKRWRLAEEDMRDSAERDFHTYVRPLETVTLFKYLGQVLTKGDDDWTEVVGNLKKEQKNWEQLSRIQGQEGANPRVSGMFFKAVVQEVLIFGSETWVLTPAWNGTWEVFDTGSRGGSKGGILLGRRRGAGIFHL